VRRERSQNNNNSLPNDRAPFWDSSNIDRREISIIAHRDRAIVSERERFYGLHATCDERLALLIAFYCVSCNYTKFYISSHILTYTRYLNDESSCPLLSVSHSAFRKGNLCQAFPPAPTSSRRSSVRSVRCPTTSRLFLLYESLARPAGARSPYFDEMQFCRETAITRNYLPTLTTSSTRENGMQAHC